MSAAVREVPDGPGGREGPGGPGDPGGPGGPGGSGSSGGSGSPVSSGGSGGLLGTESGKNAAVAALVAVTLLTGIVLAIPGSPPQGPPPLPGPLARAQTAAQAGTPASLAELNALITDREKWLRKHPRDEESWATLGTAYTERGARRGDWAAYAKAETALKRSLTIRSGEHGNTEALLGLAGLANARGDYPAARDYATLARKQKPRRWTVHRALVDAYAGLGAKKAVQKSLESVQNLYGGSQARALAARVYRELGWREDATANAYDAVGGAQNATEKAVALWRLGELAWERGDHTEAVTSFDTALRLAPDQHPALAARARALTALGRTDEAVRDWRAALSKAPLPQYALEAGELYEALGRDAEAAESYGQVRTLADRAAAHGANEGLALARYEAEHGDPGDAAEAARRLKEEWDRGVRSPWAADALAWALFRSGRGKEALPYAMRATKEGARSAMFAYHRGELERSLGMYGAARRHIGDALRINPEFSPLLAPAARSALTALGDPPAGGPRKLTGREGLGAYGPSARTPRRTTGTGTGSGTGTGPAATR
ncbi:tetratricopeptide repeat protein [Streptomyces qinzhouensis]|uniref:tetratricopeptide repeat protein n=1 Tax=Streptomyces qinzhouensis TaxID=2599401 RepID=UPI001FEBFFF6|nr:tetratricopeptide repeat protein [Streptomyces qinzhouensis]